MLERDKRSWECEVTPSDIDRHIKVAVATI